MCATCGCGEDIHDHDHDHSHSHDHGHDHSHGHNHDHAHGHAHVHSREPRMVQLEADILGKNALDAAKNRGYFQGRRLLALNLVSSPGSGKTTLLERTIRDLGSKFPFAVIQGDQATDHDAERVRRAGAQAVQLNTGTVCHLDAAMVERALRDLDPPAGAVLAIENVGNLVCPALFDLGEQERVVVASFAEGDDKPIKYPYMFRSASLVVLNKSDLAPYVPFDAQKFPCVRGSSQPEGARARGLGVARRRFARVVRVSRGRASMSAARNDAGLADPFAALEQMDPAVLEQAMEFLQGLSQALFPGGPPDREQMTWQDRQDVALLSQDGQIRSTEERLRAAEARFATLVEQIPAVTFMAVLGEGENEMYVSPHVEQLLGYTQEEWLSDPFLWYNRLHPEDRPMWNEEFARGCYTGGPFRAECRFRARDGRTVWVHGEARLVRDELGRPQFLQGVAFDITESKNAQKVLLEGAVRQARIDEELEIAKRVQSALIPTTPTLENLEIAVIMAPADDVGGDYFDVQPTSFGGWIAVGDVSGHGLNAGLVMLMLQSAMLTVQQALPNATPGEALAVVNRILYKNVAERLKRPEYVTTNLLRYEVDGRITFAGGHQYIVVCRTDGTITRVQTPGPWLGIIEAMPRAQDFELVLKRGDVMVLYTDGIIEARDRAGRLFEMERLCAAVQTSHRGSVAEIRDAIMTRVRAFMHEQEDDMTLMVMRYIG